jgi:hypothetical protein
MNIASLAFALQLAYTAQQFIQATEYRHSFIPDMNVLDREV